MYWSVVDGAGSIICNGIQPLYADFHRMSEATFWKLVAWGLGLILSGILVFNLAAPFRVPASVTSFLLGLLFSVGVGYSVVCPASSPVRLARRDEDRFRRQQYAVGVVMSLVLAATLLVREVRSEPAIWGLAPLILLSPALILREYLAGARMRSRRKKHT